MFINSKVKLLVKDGDESYIIPKDYIGDIPEHIAKTWLVQMAIKSGHIVTPENKSDKALYTLFITTQSRQTYRTLVYVEK